MMRRIYFLVESGPLLDQVKALAQKYHDQTNAMRQFLIRELPSAERFHVGYCGEISGIRFGENPIPEGFTKPHKNGVSRPKKGSEWERKFATVERIVQFDIALPELINFPDNIITRNGVSMAYGPWNPLGLAYLHYQNGPFLIYMPDIETRVKERLTAGDAVEEPALSYKTDFEGCRKILKEEWDLFVAKAKLEAKS